MGNQGERWDRLWKDDAACKDASHAVKFTRANGTTYVADPWFPRRGENEAALYAKRVCSGCPVRADCLQDAVMGPWDLYGIWAGAGESKRRIIRRVKKTSPHPSSVMKQDCDCDLCELVEDYWRRLEVTAETGRGPSPAWNINGPRATHGSIASYRRGCLCPECTKAGNPSAAA
jgi:hypothetical protein